MIRALEVPVRSALLMMIGLTIVLAGGCAMPSTEDVSSAAQSGPGALREAALEELRSIPPSQPMAGPAVPGIFTQADAAQVVGHNDFKIIAQESPSWAIGTVPVWPKDMGMTADIKVVTVPRADQVLLVSVCASDQFPQWAAGKTAVAKVISGLGDAAFSGPQGDVEPNVVAFRKGPRAIRVVSLLSPDQEGYVSQAELVELAEIIAARMP